MNICCYPRILGRKSLRDLLGIAKAVSPEFGAPGNVPLSNGHRDTTEVDMLLGDTFFEAKLTETDFTSAPRAK